MKIDLIDALLATQAGSEIRKILQLPAERFHIETVYVRSQRLAGSEPFCDVRALIAKVDRGELAQNAAEVVFRCLGVTALDWHSSFYDENDRPPLALSQAGMEIETDGSFRIACARIEVASVEPYKLGECFEK